MAKSAPKAQSNSRFIGAIIAVAIIGIAVLGYAVSRPRAGIKPVDPNLVATATQGHLVGREDAPVQIIEFLDYECPTCGNWAMVTEPDVRERLINTGQVAIRIYDFPLPMHRNTWPASNAVACAADQNKYLEMHDKVFATQDQWNGEATSNPKPVFLRLAGELGMNTREWEACFDTQKHYSELKGSAEEAMRRGVNGTPTFVIGSKMISDRISYDDFKKYVDEAMARAAAASKGAKSPGKAPAGAPPNQAKP